MGRKHPEENQKGGSMEQVIVGFEGIYGADVERLQQVEDVVNSMCDLYGMGGPVCS